MRIFFAREGKWRKLTHNYDVKRAIAVYTKTDLNGSDRVRKRRENEATKKSLAFLFLPFCTSSCQFPLQLKDPRRLTKVML